MKRTDKAYVIKIFKDNQVLLIVGFCVYCFICGLDLSDYPAGSLDLFTYVLLVLTDHYYILYGMFPVMLVIMAREQRDVQDIERIRYKNAFQHIRQMTKRFCFWILLYLLFHLVLAFAIGACKFPSLNEITTGLRTNPEYTLFINEFIAHFKNTGNAIIPVFLYMWCGYTVLAALFSYINTRFGSQKMIQSSVLIYILTFIGFKTPLGRSLPVLCFENYILLHHTLFVNDGLNLFVVLVAEILLLSFSLGVPQGSKKHSFGELILSRREVLITLALPGIGILLEVFRSMQTPDFNWSNVLANVFSGVSRNDDLSFIAWLGLSILYMTPLFFIGTSASRLKQYGQSPVLIRFKSQAAFRATAERRYALYLIFYVLVTAIIGNILLALPVTAPGISHGVLYELYGQDLTVPIFSLYMLLFGMYLLFDFVVFRLCSRVAGEIFGFCTLALIKFIFFLIPGGNVLDLNFGIMNLYEDVLGTGSLIPVIICLIIADALYFVILNRKASNRKSSNKANTQIRRLRHVDH